MRKTKTGWVADIRNPKDFTVEGETPTGVFLSISRRRTYIYHAGLDQATSEQFELPSDPHMMREIAAILTEAAELIETNRL